jgi:hypothetical protein
MLFGGESLSLPNQNLFRVPFPYPHDSFGSLLQAGYLNPFRGLALDKHGDYLFVVSRKSLDSFHCVFLQQETGSKAHKCISTY